MTRIDRFLDTFVTTLQENEAACGLGAESTPAQSVSAVRVLVHAKSIPLKVRVTHVSSAFWAGPSSATDSSYGATIVNSTQATDRHAGRPTVLGRALQTHNEWCKAPSRFAAMIGRGGRDGQSLSYSRPRRPG